MLLNRNYYTTDNTGRTVAENPTISQALLQFQNVNDRRERPTAHT